MVVFCTSTVFIAVASAEPSPTPNHIKSRIRRQSVQSTAIANIGYSKRRHILEIEFVNGAVYRYFDVPVGVYGDLTSAESKTRFYDSNIRNTTIRFWSSGDKRKNRRAARRTSRNRTFGNTPVKAEKLRKGIRG